VSDWKRIALLSRTGKRVHVRLYNIWDKMKKRCHRPYDDDYKHYGAKGIRVCVEWYNDYATFRSWAVSHGYAKGLTLDRIRNAEGYGPDNCRWATREEQTYNSSRCHNLTLNGVTKLLPVWAKELGMSMFTLRHRRSAGWTDEQILTTPLLANGNYRPGVEHKKRGRKGKSPSADGAVK
jgi:hypothetical protein